MSTNEPVQDGRRADPVHPEAARAPETREEAAKASASLISERSALIGVLALLAGGLVAWLLILAGHHPAEATAAGLGTAGAAVLGLNQLIGR